MRYASHIADLVGNTPLVRLNSVTRGIRATVLAKVEYFNPGASSKDRIAKNIIDAAERDGLLGPGGTIVEPTSGNTGVGLALVALQRGYRMIFVVPDKFAGEKVAVLKAYGAEVVTTPTSVPPEDPRSYYSVSDRLAREIPGAFKPNQFANLNGPRGHYETTGPEIWRDTDGKITHFVAAIGTGGTISGTGRYLKEASSGAVTVIGADPQGSIYSGGPIHGYLVEGVGEDFWPATFDPSVVDSYEQGHRRRVVRDDPAPRPRGRSPRRRLLRHGRRRCAPDGAGAAVGRRRGRAASRPRPRLPLEALRRRMDADNGFDIRSVPITTRLFITPPPRKGQHDHSQRSTGFASLAVHAGQDFDPTTGAVIPPVHFSTTFVQDGIGGLRDGYEYGRSGNPTRTACSGSSPRSRAALMDSRSRPGSPPRTLCCARCSALVTMCFSEATSTAGPTASLRASWARGASGSASWT